MAERHLNQEIAEAVETLSDEQNPPELRVAAMKLIVKTVSDLEFECESLRETVDEFG